MDTLLAELRYALRRLRKSPVFSAIVVLTLALGIGANTAIFSVVDAVLLRPLPYERPSELVTIEHLYPSLNNLKAPVSAPGFKSYRDRTRSFSAVAVQSGWQPNLTGKGDPERLSGSRVSGLWFKVYGVAPLLGRTLLPDEDQEGKNHVVVLSYPLWQRLFNGDARAIGQTLDLNGENYQIVGVMPASFRNFFNRRTEIWTPLALKPSQLDAQTGFTNEYLSLSARVKPGVTIEQAKAEMRNFAAQLKQQFTNQFPRDWSLLVTPLSEKATGDVRPALFVLLGAVGFVLLIACANVANLLLARAAARLKEVAIRSALGAKAWQLGRQLLIESVLLALIGGALGLLLAYWSVKALVAFNPTNLPRADEITVNGVVMLFTLFISIATGLLFGIVPALQTVRPNLNDTLREGGRSGSADRGGQLMRRSLVVAEVALALTLLTGAGLLIKSFARLQDVDPGFEPKHLLTFNMALPKLKYPQDTQQVAFYQQALERVGNAPGVRGVGMTSVLPFGGDWSTGGFNVEGYSAPPNQPGPWGDIRVVSGNFFKTMGVPLIKGRTLDDLRDRKDAPNVVVVDEEMVKRYWPNVDPIGKRISFGDPTKDTSSKWITVVGVVAHTKHEGLDAEARVQLYFDFQQAGPGLLNMAFAVRTAGDPLAATTAVRNAIHEVDRDVPLSNVKSMDQLLEMSVGQRRLSMLLLGVFAGIALVLASLGIYGVMSYSVAQRARELGVRMALGAARGNVLGLVLRQGMTLTVMGVVIGLLGAFALTRLMASQLYAVKATDPLTFTLVALLLTTIAAVATLVPALRATRVDPVVALRDE